MNAGLRLQVGVFLTISVFGGYSSLTSLTSLTSSSGFLSLHQILVADTLVF